MARFVWLLLISCLSGCVSVFLVAGDLTYTEHLSRAAALGIHEAFLCVHLEDISTCFFQYYAHCVCIMLFGYN